MKKMNKYFLIILALTSFFSATAQDSTVCIKPSTARYYLEIEDEALILREKDSISNELIFTMSESLLVKDQIIHTYQQDSISYVNMETTFTSHLELVRSELDRSEREVRKQKALKFLTMGLAVLGGILLL